MPQLRSPELRPIGQPDLNRLMLYHDRQFVEMAYSLILGRPADDEGLADFLQCIRTGESRREVAFRMRRIAPRRGSGALMSNCLGPIGRGAELSACRYWGRSADHHLPSEIQACGERVQTAPECSFRRSFSSVYSGVQVMHITFLSTYPTAIPRHGGQHRVANMIDALQTAGHEVRSVGVLGSDSYPTNNNFLPFPGYDALRRYIEDPFLMEDWAIGQWAVKDAAAYRSLSRLIDKKTDAIFCEHPWLFAFARKFRAEAKRSKIILVNKTTMWNRS